MVAIPEVYITPIDQSHISTSGVTGGREIDADALALTPIDKLRAVVLSELESSILRAHLDLINSKDQFTMARYLAADIVSSHPLEYQVPPGEPVLDWYARELTPRLWKHFDPLAASMIVVACYGFISCVGTELLTKDAEVHPQAPNFPDRLSFKTGLSPIDGVDVVTALRTLADEGICVRGRVLAALVDEPQYRANFDGYAKGITHFHTSSPRYR
ncbi:hypothetical protein DL765_005526 [Monosporascus sp. GIB2]|nr:hypothetical protein DL765_005526 [Monosporascus sp. GIB2]